MKKHRGQARRKPSAGPKLALAIVTCLNLTLTLILAILRRQDTLKAISSDGRLKLLLDQPDSKTKSE